MAGGTPRKTNARIRVGTRSDAPALAAFAAATFRETYGSATSPTDMQEHIDRQFHPEAQAAELAAPDWRTLLVEADGELIAYAQLRRGEAPSSVRRRATKPTAVALEIRRFYVDSRWHGQGIAQDLMAACLRDTPPEMPVWLSVFMLNARAIAFYAKCGFRIVGQTTFLVGRDPQHDHVMEFFRDKDAATPSQGR